jgi:hypothetical protein
MAMSPLRLKANPDKSGGGQLSIKDLIEQIAAGWSSYHQKVRVDKTDPVYALVTVDETQRPNAVQG